MSAGIGAQGRSSLDYGCCSGCHMTLHEPFIQCYQCFNSIENSDDTGPSKVRICLSCFSRGREFSGHKSNHDFTVVKNSFSIFDATWNANEELLLLKNLLMFGHGNWVDIAKAIPSKTVSECEDHFEHFYLNNASGDFKRSLHRTGDEPGRRDEPFTYLTHEGKSKKSSGLIDSGIFYGTGIVRPSSGTQIHKELAGYNAARSDFASEQENNFEVNLNSIEVNDHMYENVGESLDNVMAKRPFECDKVEENYLQSALSTSMLSIYNGKLKDRKRRKRIVREYGLLNKAKVMCLPSRYPHLNCSAAKYGQLYKLGSRLMCSLNFDFLLEGIHHEMLLRQQILYLQEYREGGLRRFAGVNVFDKLKVAREKQLRELSMMNETIRDWLLAENSSKSHLSFYEDKDNAERLIPTTLGSTRRTAAPMNIVGLPAYDKLGAEERDLCSEQRVLPEVFMEIKTMMVDECMKNSGLKLADIRPIVKIDVNKTKKIYDFFLKNELIYKPVDTD